MFKKIKNICFYPFFIFNIYGFVLTFFLDMDDDSLVSDKEKTQLQQEFLSFMENRFICGEESFDYSIIDLNPMYIDNIADQDLEDQYFDAEDPD